MWCAGIAKHDIGARQHAPPSSSSLSLSLSVMGAWWEKKGLTRQGL